MTVMKIARRVKDGEKILITDETHGHYVDDTGEIYKPDEIEFIGYRVQGTSSNPRNVYRRLITRRR